MDEALKGYQRHRSYDTLQVFALIISVDGLVAG